MTNDKITDAQRLGRAIAEIRDTRGMTQKEVATRAQLSVNYISYVENGERNVTQETLNKIADALRVPVQWIWVLGGKTPSKGRTSCPWDELALATKESIRALLAAEQAAQSN